jgi:TonB family protein
VASFPDGQVQLSFVANVEYLDSRIRDFYVDWAAEDGWTKVSSDEEPWSADEWQSFEDMYGSSTDQYLVHWRSPDGSESLRLALRHINDQTRQEVYVIRSPFQLLIPDPADAYAADATEDSRCPHGEFEEPVARHEPLPPGGLLQDRCPEPLIDPNLYISVNSDGKVESIDLLRSSGCDHADEELRRCLSHWRFAPATCDGQPIFVHRSLVVGWDDERPPPSDPHRCRPFEEADELPP